MKYSKKLVVRLTIGIVILIIIIGIWLLVAKHQKNRENTDEQSSKIQTQNNNDVYGVHSIKKLLISKNGKKIMEFVKDNSRSGNSFKTSDMRMIYPYDESAGSDKFDTLTKLISDIEIIDVIEDAYPNASDYGFDNDITFYIEDDNDVSHTIKLGTEDKDGNVYTMYNDEQNVFTINPSLKNEVKDINPFDYIDKLAHIYSIKDVSSIEISYHNKKHILAIQRSGDKVYTVDGNKINEDNFKTIYQEVIGVDIIDFATGVSKGEKVGEVTFVMMNGARETTGYYEYDNQKLLVVKPNEKQYLTLKEYIENIIDAIE